MRLTKRRRGWLLVTLLMGLVIIASLVGSASHATATTRPSVALSRSSATVLSGDQVVLTAHTVAARRGSSVVLQQRRGTAWVTWQSHRPGPRGSVDFVLHPSDGAHAFRALLLGPSRHLWATSPRTGVAVLACAPATAPQDGLRTAFAHPGERTISPVARRLAGIFCAAAPHARVRIAMYFIRAVNGGPDVDLIVQTLRRVARYHHVHVAIVMEGRLYRPGRSLAPSLRLLRTFATVHLCNAGCHNERPGLDEGGSPSIMHHKFITVSDMSWRPGVDPDVVVASGNWSNSQLRNHWSSLVDVHGDHRLTDEFDAEWLTLSVCADHGCAAWAPYLARSGLSVEDHGLSVVDDLWRDHPTRVRSGDVGRGTSAIFSPWMRRDPLARALSGLTCTPQHHTVRLAQMFLTGARRDLLDTLAQLGSRGSGCGWSCPSPVVTCKGRVCGRRSPSA